MFDKNRGQKVRKDTNVFIFFQKIILLFQKIIICTITTVVNVVAVILIDASLRHIVILLFPCHTLYPVQNVRYFNPFKSLIYFSGVMSARACTINLHIVSKNCCTPAAMCCGQVILIRFGHRTSRGWGIGHFRLSQYCTQVFHIISKRHRKLFIGWNRGFCVQICLWLEKKWRNLICKNGSYIEENMVHTNLFC